MEPHTPKASRKRTRPPAKLSTLFTRDYIGGQCPETMGLWDRHLDGDIEADHEIFEHFAPLCRIEAMRLKHRRPGLFANVTLEEMISDGALGLLHAIRLARLGNFGFILTARKRIRCTIHGERHKRSWQGEKGYRKIGIVCQTRARLTAQLGQVPTAEEMLAALRGHIHNPQVFIGEREIYAMSDVDTDFDPYRATPSVRDDQDERAITADMIRLAKKGLHGTDRKILAMLLKGDAPKTIAKKLHLNKSTLNARMNGVLWQCKCNAQLAEYLGVAPEKMPKKDHRGNLPSVLLRFLREVA